MKQRTEAEYAAIAERYAREAAKAPFELPVIPHMVEPADVADDLCTVRISDRIEMRMRYPMYVEPERVFSLADVLAWNLT